MRLGELLICTAHPKAATAIEQQPCKPGERWERERAVCGQGLVDLHRAVVALNQPGAPEPTLAADAGWRRS